MDAISFQDGEVHIEDCALAKRSTPKWQEMTPVCRYSMRHTSHGDWKRWMIMRATLRACGIQKLAAAGKASITRPLRVHPSCLVMQA